MEAPVWQSSKGTGQEKRHGTSQSREDALIREKIIPTVHGLVIRTISSDPIRRLDMPRRLRSGIN